MNDLIVGIDLGTTNSEISMIRDGHPFVFPGADGDPILPSVVGVLEDGRLLVGKQARNQYAVAPERTIKSIKRRMGESVQVQLGAQSFRPQEISAIILKALKDRAEENLGHPISKAVITVPAYFNDTQRQATIEAGTIAGLEVVRILNEPTAAALVYDPDPTQALKVLVYDLGGGTFDVSIVQSEGGVVEVLASHGDTHLGGDDFDDLLLNHLSDQFLALHGVDPRENPISKARLLRACEDAKKKLSDLAVVRIQEEFLGEKDGVALHLDQEFSRVEFEELLEPLLMRTLSSVDRAMTDANLIPRQIDRIVLVGGSTRIPLISRLLEEKLGKPCHQEIHPDLCVAMGAAVQGAIIQGKRVGTVLVDITPHSLGIRTIDPDWDPYQFGDAATYHFSPVIRRGTALPTTRSESYSTISDNQPVVQIEIYQGESEDVRQNHCIGNFTIEGLSRVPAGNQILVQFDMSLNGTLKVSAKEKTTGLQKQIVIENKPQLLGSGDRVEASERLRNLWENEVSSPSESEVDDDESIEDAALLHRLISESPINSQELDEEQEIPELLSEPAEGQRETVMARALMDRAERLKSGAASEDQAEIDALIKKMQSALTDRNWNDLNTASTELTDILFYLEDS
jgi:molecular chaperone DnaK